MGVEEEIWLQYGKERISQIVSQSPVLPGDSLKIIGINSWIVETFIISLPGDLSEENGK